MGSFLLFLYPFIFHTVKLRYDSCQHGEKTGTSAEYIRYRLGHEHTICSKVEDVWQQVCKRNYDDRLPEKGEEYSLLFLVQRFEGGLANILQQHECERGEIYFQGRDGVIYE